MAQPVRIPPTMRAALLRGPRDLVVAEVAVPTPGLGEVLVQVEANGLCGSDLHFFTGERPLAEPMVLGHEFVGRVVAAGPDADSSRIGQRVVIEPNIPCGTCLLCGRGLGRICKAKQIIGVTRWGGLAEYAAVPQAFAWPVAEGVSTANAATVEPTAVAVHAFQQAEAAPGATIGVVGCGGVGIGVAKVAIANGCRVIAIEPSERRRAAALEAGVEQVLGAASLEAARAFLADAEVIIECAGFAATAQLCLDAASPGTRIVLIGLSSEDVTINPLRFVRSELNIRGSIIYDHPADFAATIELVASGRLQPGDHAAAPRPLEDLVSIFEAMEAGTLGKKPLVAPAQKPSR